MMLKLLGNKNLNNKSKNLKKRRKEKIGIKILKIRSIIERRKIKRERKKYRILRVSNKKKWIQKTEIRSRRKRSQRSEETLNKVNNKREKAQ